MNRATRSEVVDAITTEVIRNKLEGIANEMELTLLKSSFSPIVKEGLDTSASLFTASGETLVFSIIANNFTVPTSTIDAAADRALLRLAMYSTQP